MKLLYRSTPGSETLSYVSYLTVSLVALTMLSKQSDWTFRIASTIDDYNAFSEPNRLNTKLKEAICASIKVIQILPKDAPEGPLTYDDARLKLNDIFELAVDPSTRYRRRKYWITKTLQTLAKILTMIREVLKFITHREHSRIPRKFWYLWIVRISAPPLRSMCKLTEI